MIGGSISGAGDDEGDDALEEELMMATAAPTV